MIKLHKGQSKVYKDIFIDQVCRFAVVRCSRGWGKSYCGATIAGTAIFELLELHPYVPHKVVYIIAPTYDQVIDIYYPLINYDLGFGDLALKSSKDTGRFIFPNNVELRLLSYESIERMRGKGAYFVLWDELCSCKKGIKPRDAWQGVIQPAIITRWSAARAISFGAKSPGRAAFIGTPKGYNFFKELSDYEEENPLWKSYHFDYRSSPFLDIDEIESIKHNIDPIEFASEYMATFENSGNNVFYCFDRKIHVDRELEYFRAPKDGEPGEDVHVGIDFNVGLQCSSMSALRGGQLHVLDEVKGHPDTETLAISLATKFKGHKIFAYPDPTGRSRKTSAPVGVTDFTILKDHGITVLARSHSPAIVDSVASVNRMLKNAAGDVNVRIHPRCRGLLESLERTKWVDNNSDTATIDKSEGIEHFGDGFRYKTEFMFPIKKHSIVTSRGFGF
jgi:hypothetical protein